jgi:hypothetical protein
LPRYTPAGRRIAICPAIYTDATCKICSACANVRDAVIGFPAHGAWRRVEAATAARDVAVGKPWTFPEHRTMAEVIAEETTTACRLDLSDLRIGEVEALEHPAPTSRSTSPLAAAMGLFCVWAEAIFR